MQRIRTLALLVFVALAGPSSAASAYTIEQLDVLPSPPVPRGEPVTFAIGIQTPSSEAFLFSPTSVSVMDRSIEIDVFVDSGILTAIDFLVEEVELGVLDPGDYAYDVVLHTPRESQVDRVQGGFSVVPEPATAARAGLGLAALGAASRRRRV